LACMYMYIHDDYAIVADGNNKLKGNRLWLQIATVELMVWGGRAWLLSCPLSSSLRVSCFHHVAFSCHI